MRSEKEINDACTDCPKEYREKRRCYKEEGVRGICLLACQIQRLEKKEKNG